LIFFDTTQYNQGKAYGAVLKERMKGRKETTTMPRIKEIVPTIFRSDGRVSIDEDKIIASRMKVK